MINIQNKKLYIGNTNIINMFLGTTPVYIPAGNTAEPSDYTWRFEGEFSGKDFSSETITLQKGQTTTVVYNIWVEPNPYEGDLSFVLDATNINQIVVYGPDGNNHTIIAGDVIGVNIQMETNVINIQYPEELLIKVSLV